MNRFICLYTFSLKIRKYTKFLLAYIIVSAIVNILILFMLGQNPEAQSCVSYLVWLAQLSSLGCSS